MVQDFLTFESSLLELRSLVAICTNLRRIKGVFKILTESKIGSAKSGEFLGIIGPSLGVYIVFVLCIPFI
jgi:hypothetical protein